VDRSSSSSERARFLLLGLESPSPLGGGDDIAHVVCCGVVWALVATGLPGEAGMWFGQPHQPHLM
jgi:hypothetical protein